MNLKIISGNSNIQLAKDVSTNLNINLTDRTIKKFADGEIYVQIGESVRGEDVFVIQSLSNPVNENLMELLILIDALKRASAGRITAVITYYCYARQDRKTDHREPISSKLVADMLTVAGANRLLVIDLHAPQIQGFFNIPVDEISIIPLFANYFKEKSINDGVVVSPDTGGVKRARMLANRLNMPLAIIDKRRTTHNQVEFMNIVGNIDNKTVIIVDDIIDTGNSILQPLEKISQYTKEIYLCATHAVFSNNCDVRLGESNISEVIISNTIPYQGNVNKIKVINISNFLASVIKNIHENKSVSGLFK